MPVVPRIAKAIVLQIQSIHGSFCFGGTSFDKSSAVIRHCGEEKVFLKGPFSSPKDEQCHSQRCRCNRLTRCRQAVQRGRDCGDGPSSLQSGPHCLLVLFIGRLARFILGTFLVFNNLLVKCLWKTVLETNYFPRSLFIETYKYYGVIFQSN